MQYATHLRGYQLLLFLKIRRVYFVAALVAPPNESDPRSEFYWTEVCRKE
jgi:hypothetical protein